MADHRMEPWFVGWMAIFLATLGSIFGCSKDSPAPSRTAGSEARAMANGGAGALPGASSAEQETRVLTVPAIPDDPHSPNTFTCRVGRRQLILSFDGKGAWGDSGVPGFNVKVEPGYVHNAWCAALEDDALVLLQLTDDDSAWGTAIRVGTRGEIRWSSPIDGFNIGPALIDRSAVYVSAIGFIGKIDTASGKYLWQHRGLYRDPGINNSFGAPRLTGRTVIFPAEHSLIVRSGTAPGALEVDSKSGTILTGAPPPENDPAHSENKN